MKQTISFKGAMKFVGFLLLSVLCFVLGAGGNVMMAAAADLPDAGKTGSGTASPEKPMNVEGAATMQHGRENGDPDFYVKDIDQKICKIRPMATPIDQISRQASAQQTDSFVVKYYSVGTRPTKTLLKEAVVKQTGGDRVSLKVEDPNIFTIDDTIRVCGVPAVTKENGSAYDAKKEVVPDLVLCVCGKDSEGYPQVFAVNGEISTETNNNIWLPAINAKTVLVRMGKSCGELDVQTGRFNNLPTAEEQYCQNYMIQVEQSTIDKMSDKEVDWNFTDLEEDAIYDMRVTQEMSILFGDKNVIKHASKDGMARYFTKGIWWMGCPKYTIGHWDEKKNACAINDDDLVDFSRDIFVGTGLSNGRKIMFCGSDLLATLSKVESEKFRLKDSVEKWNLKFKSWETDFGEILTIHHELFNQCEMKDCGFVLDPEYLTKKTFLSFKRNVLDLKKAGIRNTDAAVLQEISCLYLRYPKAHARVQLAHK